MIKTFLVCLALLFLYSGCSAVSPANRPKYKEVDPRVQPLVDEYMWLSKQNDIRFYNKVTIGFTDINEGNDVGLCTYGFTFREIDIDTTYWNHSTNIQKMTLLFHELSHAYCTRHHDYGARKYYPESDVARIALALEWKVKGGPRPGYWDDGCPVSILYPVIVDDDCMLSHYAEYVKEMFDRCESY